MPNFCHRLRISVRERDEGSVGDGADAAGGGDLLVQLDEVGPHGIPQDLRAGGKGELRTLYFPIQYIWYISL